MRKQLKTEHLLLLILVTFILAIGGINYTFLMPANLIDLLRSIIVTGIMAIGVAIVIISGGIDISFPAISAFCMYSATKLFNHIDFQGNAFPIFLMVALIGFALGCINAFIIHIFKLPAMIVTLGTSSIFSGIHLTWIGSREIYSIPEGLKNFAQINLISVTNERGAVSALPVSILFLGGMAILVWIILRYTMLGRSIYAIGGDINAAERVGFPIFKTRLFVYGFSGMLAGIAGLIHISMMRMCNPFDILGTELTVIACVVLGGVSITGGSGSIPGTMLGVLLVTVINKSLIIVGVSSYWQQFFIGIMILFGTGVVSLKEKYRNRIHNI